MNTDMNTNINTQPLKKYSENVFTAKIPGSKSYTNRALILAAQRLGVTEITGALHCDDTKYLAQSLNAFDGLSVETTTNGFRVTRTKTKLNAPSQEVFLNGGGTPARFLMAFAASVVGKTIITGNARLSERPMAALLRAFDQMGVKYECLKTKDCLPIAVYGKDIESTHWKVDGSVSSQFLSALLLLASQQYNQSNITVEVTGHLVSKSYVDMTLSMLRKVGVKAEHNNYKTFNITPKMPEAAEIQVETDASGMSYFLVAAAITKTKVKVPGIGKHSVQGDLGLAFALEKMGCALEMTDDSITLEGKNLCGIDIDMDSMPDTVMSLAIAASQADGVTSITNIANLRVKECDRIHATCTELGRLGTLTEEGTDSIVIYPPSKFRAAKIETYDDHRVAMSFGLLTLLYADIVIKEPECVAKSFPEYWSEVERFRQHHENNF